VHNVKAVIATGLKPDIAILQSLNYTRCNFRTLPTSGLGVAIVSVPHGQKSAVLSPTISVRKIATLSNIEFL